MTCAIWLWVATGIHFKSTDTDTIAQIPANAVIQCVAVV